MSSVWDTAKPFVIGGLSGMTATSVIQPIDTVKVRIQIRSEEMGATGVKMKLSPIAVASEIISKEGPKSLYKGLDSALIRQATYGTARLGTYNSLFAKIKEKNNGKNPSLFEKMCISSFAGFVGSMIGNPADLSLVRFQADMTMPPEKRRNYKHFGDALTRIIKEEGVLALWRGCMPTVARAIAMNVSMLVSYDEAKERITKLRGVPEDRTTQLLSSAVSGIACSLTSLPFDNVKTKVQKMKPGPDGKLPYAGFFDCLQKSIMRESVIGLWVGYPTYYFRIAPHAMITLMTQEFLRNLFAGAPKKQVTKAFAYKIYFDVPIKNLKFFLFFNCTIFVKKKQDIKLKLMQHVIMFVVFMGSKNVVLRILVKLVKRKY